MNGIPAKVAGVGEVLMVVPTPGGEQSELVLAAAALCGVDRVYTIGGAQAIGALAYGTQSIRRSTRSWDPGTLTWPRQSGAYSEWLASTWWRGPRRSW